MTNFAWGQSWEATMKEFYVSCILVEAYKVYQVGKGEKQEQRHEDVKTKDTISSLK